MFNGQYLVNHLKPVVLKHTCYMCEKYQLNENDFFFKVFKSLLSYFNKIERGFLIQYKII